MLIAKNRTTNEHNPPTTIVLNKIISFFAYFNFLFFDINGILIIWAPS